MFSFFRTTMEKEIWIKLNLYWNHFWANNGVIC
jgi:hypothetical protein